MPSLSVRDVLKLIGRFHARLAERYGELAHTAEQPRVRMLAVSMEDAEARLSRCWLQPHERDGTDRVLGYWFTVAPIVPGDLSLDELDLSAHITPEDLMDTALRVDERLAGLCRRIADGCTSPAVRELFLNLAEQEEGEERRTARATLSAELDQ
jgi:hypothetical protein